MGKYNRILVATDGSEPSLHALQEAFKLSTTWVTVVAVSPFYEGDLRLLGMPKSDRLIREPCETALARAEELAAAASARLAFHMAPRMIKAPTARARHMMMKLALERIDRVVGLREISFSPCRYSGTARARLTATMIMMVPMTTLIMCSLT